jgi:predicted nucleic acid-binding protein
LSAYLDTSFLVSLYTIDANSATALTMIAEAKGPFPLAALCELELTNAVQLRVFRREITAAHARAVVAAFRSDVASGFFQLVPMTAVVFDQALRLSRRHAAAMGVRTFDILHVATALTLRLPAIYTFDPRQAQLARAAGLKTPVSIP